MDIATYLAEEKLSQAAFAESIHVSQGRISQWIGGETIPAERCVEIEEATDGKVTRQDLRPDLFGKPKTGIGRPVALETAQVRSTR